MGSALLHKLLHVPFRRLILLWGLKDCFSWSQRLCCTQWWWVVMVLGFLTFPSGYDDNILFPQSLLCWEIFVQETEQRPDSYFRIVRYGVSTTKDGDVFHRISGFNHPEWCCSPRLWLWVLWPFMAWCTLCSVNCQRKRAPIRSI